jgi:hypothetical protein
MARTARLPQVREPLRSKGGAVICNPAADILSGSRPVASVKRATRGVERNSWAESEVLGTSPVVLGATANHVRAAGAKARAALSSIPGS